MSESEAGSHDVTLHLGSPGFGASGISMEPLFCDPAVGGRQMSYATNAVLCEPDHPASDVYFIHKGQVRLHQVAPDGSSMLLEILGAGQWFGVSAIAGRATCGVRATAVGPVLLTKSSAAAVMSHVCTNPENAKTLVRELAGRHCEAYEDSARMVFDDCNSRLIKTLLRFSDTAAATRRGEADGGGVVLRITHQQLAQAVGVARETVSLALTQLRKQNMLRTGRNQLFFDPVALKGFQGRGEKRPTEV